MTLLIPLLITGYALAYNPTLHQVSLNRQQNEYLYTIPANIDIDKYDCRIGVQYDYHDLTGHEVYFLSGGRLYGPYLVSDYESPQDKGIMSARNILADIDCPEMVHKRGVLFVRLRLF